MLIIITYIMTDCQLVNQTSTSQLTTRQLAAHSIAIGYAVPNTNMTNDKLQLWQFQYQWSLKTMI